MSTERDELAELLQVVMHRTDEITRWTLQAPIDLADALLAAGYRHPRTITTTEELDALPDGSVVQSADIEFNGRTTPDIWSYRRGHWFCITAISIGGEVYRGPATEIALPATVLHEGAES
ncbi:hypothetical protein [Paenarthrobacter sp. JL.01a]|uniref:hypothetical protein n=1 Tax=Paenarthrobacter sp. JL.01a TaxID=2979324 RepID=UPI0021C58B1B|nr:hypothetical protein [Paenarthrobacter sp. JL.01a]UXM92530.1 hypothetical protein N5P29_04170 [Paenarthrobacter sp. JL.01a]